VSEEGVDIRRATPSDAAVIAALNTFVHEPHRAAMPDDYRPYDQVAAAAYFADAIGAKGHLIWLAEMHNRTVGFVEAELRTRANNPFTSPLIFVEIHQLAVASDVRRVGAGRALMHAVELECSNLGASEVRLQHRAFNEGADGFYEALGYATYSVSMRKQLL